MEYIAFNTKNKNYSTKKKNPHSSKVKRVPMLPFIKIYINKNGGQSNPVEKNFKTMNTLLGTIHNKELCVRYL